MRFVQDVEFGWRITTVNVKKEHWWIFATLGILSLVPRLIPRKMERKCGRSDTVVYYVWFCVWFDTVEWQIFMRQRFSQFSQSNTSSRKFVWSPYPRALLPYLDYTCFDQYIRTVFLEAQKQCYFRTSTYGPYWCVCALANVHVLIATCVADILSTCIVARKP